ncbi:hypothetical protein KY290_025110 [Solanum tuberosum]|uniref:Uncharacterized protein n=1 Tax=Solanum tuberosum TaxID=4113 RepID=A0ABQ7UVR9_SOLTU|nr:hypothetical protein KY290_025110 [Solanum tuberosum]
MVECIEQAKTERHISGYSSHSDVGAVEMRNAWRHGKDVSYNKLQQQCQNNVVQLVRTLYPWIKIPTNWDGVLGVLKIYKPTVYHHADRWDMTQVGWTKCNTDGASRGNPGESTYGFS